MVPAAAECQKANRTLAVLTDRCVQNRRPVELPVVAVGGIRVFNHGVHDHWALFKQGSARKRHQRTALQEPARNLGGGDRLEPTTAQVTEDPPVVANDIEGQSQPSPGFLEVWELAHEWRLGAVGDPGLIASSAFPQQTLNLPSFARGWRRDREAPDRGR